MPQSPVATMAPKGPARARRDASDRAVLARMRAERSERARSAAVERFLPLARTLARRYRRSGEPL